MNSQDRNRRYIRILLKPQDYVFCSVALPLPVEIEVRGTNLYLATGEYVWGPLFHSDEIYCLIDDVIYRDNIPLVVS